MPNLTRYDCVVSFDKSIAGSPMQKREHGEFVKFVDVEEAKILQSASPCNSDCAAALEVCLRSLRLSGIIAIQETDFKEAATRLSSVVKAQQNCA